MKETKEQDNSVDVVTTLLNMSQLYKWIQTTLSLPADSFQMFNDDISVFLFLGFYLHDPRSRSKCINNIRIGLLTLSWYVSVIREHSCKRQTSYEVTKVDILRSHKRQTSYGAVIFKCIFKVRYLAYANFKRRLRLAQ